MTWQTTNKIEGICSPYEQIELSERRENHLVFTSFFMSFLRIKLLQLMQ